jgi:recombination protein RecA
MNNALGGGLAYGRQVLIYGNKSAGKSTFSLQIIADAQKNGKVCAWIDSENSFDPDWARRLGVDTDALLVSRAHAINDTVDIGTELMKAGVDILVIDSVSACLPAVFFEKSGELKDLSDTKQIGSDARDWSHALKMLNYSNTNTLLILISQQRKMITPMYTKNVPTGGESMKFYSSTIIKLFSSESDTTSIKRKISVGNRNIDKIVGRVVSWDIEANKLGPAFSSGTYRLIFDDEPLGVDAAEELVSMLELSGLVGKSGTWFMVCDERFHGRENLVEAARTNKEFRSKVLNVLAV